MFCEADPVYSCTKQKEEIRVCTMQYAPVCGIDGMTYGNSCMAGDTEIAYQNECKTYVGTTLYAKLEAKTSVVAKMEMVLAKASTPLLEKVVLRADAYIASTKLSRIAESMQIERITKLTFIKDLIEKEIQSR